MLTAAAFAALLTTASPAWGSQVGVTTPLRLCLQALGPEGAAGLRQTGAVLEAHLVRAGVAVAWRVASTGQPCPTGRQEPEVAVLFGVHRPAQPGRCASASGGRGALGGTVVVLLPCLDGELRRARMSAAGRANPALMRYNLASLAGATAAHEVAHLLGLTHERTGLMQERFDLDGLIALAEDRLRFLPREEVQLRAAVRSRDAAVAAAR